MKLPQLALYVNGTGVCQTTDTTPSYWSAPRGDFEMGDEPYRVYNW